MADLGKAGLYVRERDFARVAAPCRGERREYFLLCDQPLDKVMFGRVEAWEVWYTIHTPPLGQRIHI